MRLFLTLFLAAAPFALANPYEQQVAQEIARLTSTSEKERLSAVQRLGYLRSESAADALTSALKDASPAIRRNAALALGWCGGRGHLKPLVTALNDSDWSVRAATEIALENLTGLVPDNWKNWCTRLETENAPAELLANLRCGEALKMERACRALGALRSTDVAKEIARTIAPWRTRTKLDFADRALVQSALRALGKLRDPDTFVTLLQWLDDPYWARYTAEALADFGDERAVLPLARAYPRFARDLAGKPPSLIPKDDIPGLEPADRMYETPFAVTFALARLPIERDDSKQAVKDIAPLLLSNIPADFDGALLYEPESAKQLTAYVLDRVGLRATAARAALCAITNSQDPAVPPDMLKAAARKVGPVIHAPCWLPVLCDNSHANQLIQLLSHDEGWVKINAAKAIMFLGEKRAISSIATILASSKREADFGYFGQFRFETRWQGQDEYDDPSPRWREAFTRALGRLGAADQIPLLIKLLDDENNALEIRTAALIALDEIGSPNALEVLARAEREHPYHSIRLLAREALWRRGTLTVRTETPIAPKPARESAPAPLQSIVFIKGDRKMPNRFQIDPWRQTYSTTDSGPTYRIGRNLHRLDLATGKLTALTHFNDGFVADCEVSWDGQSILFAHRGGDTDPWWHLFRINADGADLVQLTRGPYHDVQPAFLPDGRILFSTSRIGIRDEYHGYPATGLAVMNPDTTDLHCIAFNFGRDNEPAILPDGRIVFSRLELFYSRLKTELTVQAVHPDGTHNVTLYGPERRAYWAQVTRDSKENWWGEVPPRHRVLRTTQPQPLDAQRLIAASTAGLVVFGPSRLSETILPNPDSLALTSPFPLPDGRILCAGAKKSPTIVKGKPTFEDAPDLAIYTIDPTTGKADLLYNDPDSADFEPRPLIPRPIPPVLPECPRTNDYTARLLCGSVLNSQDDLVKERARLVRIVEGTPIVSRHANHNSPGIEAWKNHVGTLARVLGTIPLAKDGSFFAEIPADRMVHVQVLDADRRVVGNQLVWMYARPGETKSCAGCHESPNSTPPTSQLHPLAARQQPIQCLPTSNDFNYRAKFWNKGVLTDEAEERTRTVRAVNLIARE